MTLAITAAALRWVLGGTPHVVAGAWRAGLEGTALVFDDGPRLRVEPVREWVAGDGWTYARGEAGAVWVLDDGKRSEGR